MCAIWRSGEQKVAQKTQESNFWQLAAGNLSGGKKREKFEKESDTSTL